MLHGVYIVLDDDFDHLLYADPDPSELDEDLWHAACEAVDEAIEGEAKAEGILSHGDLLVGYKVHTRFGLSFMAVVESEAGARQVAAYLTQLSKRYFDEVDDARHPDRGGVEDVVVDVIPPWDE